MNEATVRSGVRGVLPAVTPEPLPTLPVSRVSSPVAVTPPSRRLRGMRTEKRFLQAESQRSAFQPLGRAPPSS